MLDVVRMQWLIPGAPLLACIGAVLFGAGRYAHRRSLISLIGSLTAAIAAIVLLVTLALTDRTSLAQLPTLDFPDWITLPGDGMIPIGWGLRASLVSSIFILMATLGILLFTVELRQSASFPPSSWSYVALSLLLLGSVGFYMATTFFQMFVCWQIAAVASFLFCVASPHQLADPVSTRKVFFIGRLGDLFWLIALFLIVDLFHSLHIKDVVGLAGVPAEQLLALIDADRGNLLVADNLRSLALIGFALTFAVAIRCAQFPFLHWLDDGCRLGKESLVLQQSLVLMPMGIYLLLRCQFLLFAAPEATRMLAVMGSVTSVIAALMALTRRDWNQIIAYASVSLIGLMLLGIVAGVSVASFQSLGLLVVTSLLVSGLFLANPRLINSVDDQEMTEPKQTIDRRWILAGLLLLGSGLAGQNRILETIDHDLARKQIAAIQEAAKADEAAGIEANNRPNPRAPFNTILAVSTLSTFLLALALLRAWYLIDDTSETNSSEKNGPAEKTNGVPAADTSMAGLFIFVGSLLTVATCIPVVQSFFWKSTPHLRSAEPILVSLVNLRMVFPLLGFAVAWAVREKFQQPVADDLQRSTDFWPSIKRVCSNGFYLSDIWFLGCSLPVRGLSQFVRFLNWFVLDGLMIGLPRRLSGALWKWSEPMRNGQLSYYVLAILVAASTLLIVLIQYRG